MRACLPSACRLYLTARSFARHSRRTTASGPPITRQLRMAPRKSSGKQTRAISRLLQKQHTCQLEHTVYRITLVSSALIEPHPSARRGIALAAPRAEPRPLKSFKPAQKKRMRKKEREKEEDEAGDEVEGEAAEEAQDQEEVRALQIRRHPFTLYIPKGEQRAALQTRGARYTYY